MRSRMHCSTEVIWILFAALSLLGCSDSDDSDEEETGKPVEMMPVTAGIGASGEGAAGAGEAGSTAGEAGMGGEPAPGGDFGKGDGSDVVTIGDSWMSLGTIGIQQSLLRVSGQPYRTYGRGGTRLLNEQIPGQYDTAKAAGPVKTVIMTGGGNDIIQVPGLRADCTAMGEMCAMVVGQILDRISQLWQEMATDGVQDVVYVQYSNPEGNNVDFALASGDGLAKRCAEVPSPLRCHRVETLDIVMGDIPDSIHPSAAAYDRIGEAVHALMIEKGMRR
jgi:lysophospholipase L1-like esterase